MNMQRLVRSPLFVWILVSCTIILAMIVLSQVDAVRVHVKQRQKELPKKIENEKRGNKRIDILFFGNSLMQSAIPAKEVEISKIISRSAFPDSQDAAKLRIVNFAVEGRSAWDIQRRADQILTLKPKLIVLQTEMIVARRVNKNLIQQTFFDEKKERLQNWIRYARTPLLERFLPGEHSERKRRELLDALASPAHVDIKVLKAADDNNTADESLEATNLQRARERWSGQPISVDSDEYKAGREFVRKARANGSTVIILEPPLSETAARLATEEYLRHRRDAMLALLDGDQRHYLQYPTVLPDKYFDDYSHANRKGQKVFFAWLAPALAERLIGAP